LVSRAVWAEETPVPDLVQTPERLHYLADVLPLLSVLKKSPLNPLPPVFHYDTLEIIKGLSAPLRLKIGRALRAVQNGGMPDHFDVLSKVGKGLTEIKASHDGEAYRTFYVAVLDDRVHVLDCIHKKSKTGKSLPPKDLARLKARYKKLAADIDMRSE
jgi:phage-related protein